MTEQIGKRIYIIKTPFIIDIDSYKNKYPADKIAHMELLIETKFSLHISEWRRIAGTSFLNVLDADSFENETQIYKYLGLVGNVVWALSSLTKNMIAAGAILSFAGVAIGAIPTIGNTKKIDKGFIKAKIEENLENLQLKLDHKKFLIRNHALRLFHIEKIMDNTTISGIRREEVIWRLMFNVPFGQNPYSSIRKKTTESAETFLKLIDKLYNEWYRKTTIIRPWMGEMSPSVVYHYGKVRDFYEFVNSDRRLQNFANNFGFNIDSDG